jgi:hypothetical protein
MPSVLAIVSKAVFEKDAKTGGRLAGPGDVVPFERYVSKNNGLAPLAEGGALFLVTVRPPDEALWLVGVLEEPKFDGESWIAPKNVVPVVDVSGVKDQIRSASGTGISAKKGALGMSLQTPRVLTDDDVALLRAGAGGASAGPSRAASKGHLNAHETGEVTPCLCRKCLPSAPESFAVGDLVLHRDRAEGGGRFLWYWYPASLEADKDAMRRAVESRLRSRAKESSPREYDDLDAVFAGGDDEEDDEE